MIITQTNVKTSMDISPTELPHAKNPDGSPKSVSLTPTELFHLGKLNIAGNDYEINNDKGAKMKVHASSVGSLLDLHTNKPVGTGTLNSVLIDSGLNMLLDTNKAFLGDKKIDPNQLQNLVHNGQKDVAQVFLPVKGDGTPDFDSMKEFRDIMTVYDTNKNKESIKVSEKRFADHGFKIKIDQVQGADGKITKVIRDNAQVKPFLAIPTLTNSATDFADNPYLVKLKGAEGDAATQLMESAWTVNGGTKSKPTSKNLTPSGYFSLEKPLAGMTYIAYRPEAPAVITSMNKHLSGPAPTMVDVQRNLNFSSNQPGSTSTNAGARVLIQ